MLVLSFLQSANATDDPHKSQCRLSGELNSIGTLHPCAYRRINMPTNYVNTVYRLPCDELLHTFQYRTNAADPAFQIIFVKGAHHVFFTALSSISQVYLYPLQRDGHLDFHQSALAPRSTPRNWTRAFDTRCYDNIYVHVRTPVPSTAEQAAAQSWASILICPPTVLARVPAAEAHSFRISALVGAGSKEPSSLRVIRCDGRQQVRFEYQPPPGITFHTAKLCVRVETNQERTDWMLVSQPYAVSDGANALLNLPARKQTYVIRARNAMEVRDSASAPVWLHEHYAHLMLHRYAALVPAENADVAVPGPPPKAIGAVDTRDFTLLVGPEARPIRVHRALLVALSPVIVMMLNPRWQPTADAERADQQRVLCLRHDCPDAWQTIVWFFYTGVIRSKNAADALRTAHLYCMDPVVFACEMTLITNHKCDSPDETAMLRSLAILYERRGLLAFLTGLPGEPDAVERFRKAVLSNQDDHRWYDHLRRIYARLHESADSTGDMQIRMAGRTFRVHSFVVDTIAPNVRSFLSAIERMLNADEVALILHHIYGGGSYNTFTNGERLREVRFDHMWHMAGVLNLPFLVGDLEAYAISEYTIFGKVIELNHNRRVRAFVNGLVLYHGYLVESQYLHNWKKKVQLKRIKSL